MSAPPERSSAPLRYADAGVDVPAAEASLPGLRLIASRTSRPEVLGGVGAFAGLFQLGAGRYRDPVLVASADGVGTKLLVAAGAWTLRERRARPRQPLRQRHPHRGRRAAVLPRLPRDQRAVAGAAPRSRRRRRRGLRGERRRAARRRDRRYAGPLLARRLRPRRLHRRRRRARGDHRRRRDRGGRRADRAALDGLADERLLAGARDLRCRQGPRRGARS